MESSQKYKHNRSSFIKEYQKLQNIVATMQLEGLFSPTPTLCFGLHGRSTLNKLNQQKSVFADDRQELRHTIAAAIHLIRNDQLTSSATEALSKYVGKKAKTTVDRKKLTQAQEAAAAAKVQAKAARAKAKAKASRQQIKAAAAKATEEVPVIRGCWMTQEVS
ncbi:hypothetical protein K440DRAFT_638266 [Wilcoxina mikolae CBS 423.85]|nr:hypothetical protein K440DRAFT_638266 [Wilcoxina mikolae CBS 423.85]